MECVSTSFFLCVAGGVMGLSYTAKEHRHRGLNVVLSYEVAKISAARRRKLLSETMAESLLLKRSFIEECIGRSQIIAIY